MKAFSIITLSTALFIIPSVTFAQIKIQQFEGTTADTRKAITLQVTNNTIILKGGTNLHPTEEIIERGKIFCPADLLSCASINDELQQTLSTPNVESYESTKKQIFVPNSSPQLNQEPAEY